MTVIPPFDAVSQDRTSDDIETTTIRSITERRRRHRLLRHSRHRSLLSPGRAVRTVRPHLSQGRRHCWPHSLNLCHLTHRRLTWKVRRAQPTGRYRRHIALLIVELIKEYVSQSE